MTVSPTRFIAAVSIKLLSTLAAFAFAALAFTAFAFAAFAFSASTFALCTTASALASISSVVATAVRLPAFLGRVAVLFVVVAILAHILVLSMRGSASKGSVVGEGFAQYRLELEVRIFAETLIVV